MVTESANNLLKHAGRGELILQGRAGRGREGRLDVLALDRGPGMGTSADASLTVSRRRAASGMGWGRSRAWPMIMPSTPPRGPVRPSGLASGPGDRCSETGPPWRSASSSVAVAGESACGDEWAVLDRDGSILVLVVDGLGHGPAAAEAAAEAVAVLRAQSTGEPGEIIGGRPCGLRGTRGAALASPGWTR